MHGKAGAGGSLLEDDSARLRPEATRIGTNQQARSNDHDRSGMSSLAGRPEKELLEQWKGQETLSLAQVTGATRMDMPSAKPARGGGGASGEGEQAIHCLSVRILPITRLSV